MGLQTGPQTGLELVRRQLDQHRELSFHEHPSILGLEAQGDSVRYDGRVVKIGAFPLGVNAAQIETASQAMGTSDVVTALSGLKSEAGLRHIMLAIDRLDYTKGIPQRLLAVERLLENEPALRGHVALVQIAAPSRDNVPAYGRYR
ncbi:MAG: trehalose-6-phosphate synthase, partial [Actinobacteria bacterium]|nr:trehalose-6-phosphate synthase [Actinomycetota bacterium]